MKKLTTLVLSILLILPFTACVSVQKAQVQVGDRIQYGNIDWIVLAVDDGKALLISEFVLLPFEYSFYDGEDTATTWEECSLRQYLNGDFFNSTFETLEQNRIIETAVRNSDNPDKGTPGGGDTTDKIFLLSIEEAKQYFPDNPARIAFDTNGTAARWWLRSPGYLSGFAAYVRSGGPIDPNGHPIILGTIGVRPALWLKL